MLPKTTGTSENQIPHVLMAINPLLFSLNTPQFTVYSCLWSVWLFIVLVHGKVCYLSSLSVIQQRFSFKVLLTVHMLEIPPQGSLFHIPPVFTAADRAVL